MVARRPRSTQQTNRGVPSRTARQRCLVNHMRNWRLRCPKTCSRSSRHGSTRPIRRQAAIARELAAGIVADYGREQERGVICFMDEFKACITDLHFSYTHRRADSQHESLLEHLFVKERRRLIGERAVLKQMFWRVHLAAKL